MSSLPTALRRQPVGRKSRRPFAGAFRHAFGGRRDEAAFPPYALAGVRQQVEDQLKSGPVIL